MKKSTRAALFSGLVFPGVGHYVLRRWIRGLLFMIPALWAFGLLFNYQVDQAMETVDKILSGEVAMDPEAIHKELEEQPPADEALLLDIAQYLLIAVWVGAAVDAYVQAGKPLEQAPAPEVV